MKKTILIGMVVLVILCNTIFSGSLEQKRDSCDNDLGMGICIETTFKTSINKEYLEVSKYQKFPYYVRQFDYLYIDNFRVINQGQNKTKEIR